jgi:hypothetical protein
VTGAADATTCDAAVDQVCAGESAAAAAAVDTMRVVAAAVWDCPAAPAAAPGDVGKGYRHLPLLFFADWVQDVCGESANVAAAAAAAAAAAPTAAVGQCLQNLAAAAAGGNQLSLPAPSPAAHWHCCCCCQTRCCESWHHLQGSCCMGKVMLLLLG